jgi:uncharacterized iron-regulated membrane protein
MTAPTITAPAPVQRALAIVRKPIPSSSQWRRFMIVTHRWISLILGIVLLAITTSGAILVYRPEIQRALHTDAYAVSGKNPAISLSDARRTVQEAHPKFEATSVWAEHGVYRVTDYTTSYTVDPGTGEILGHVGKTPSWLTFLDNLHECFFSCEDYPGYVSWLNKPIPGTAWLGHEDAKLTGGALVLGVFGVLLLYLCITGIWLWFPRPGRWKAAVSIRWKRGRFARDTDLHNVAGLISLPLMLLWAITGAGFELEPVEHAWYAATPGTANPYIEAVSAKLPKGVKKPDIGEAKAVAAATALRPHDTLVNVDLPAKDDPTGAYTMYFQSGYDPWGETEYPGEIGVFVDRHTGVAKTYYGFDNNSTAQILWEDFNYTTHTGFILNGWWRILWFVLGLAPLVLAVSGVSTWLVRRKSRKARKKATKAGTSLPDVPADVAERLAEDPEQDPTLAGVR